MRLAWPPAGAWVPISLGSVRGQISFAFVEAREYKVMAQWRGAAGEEGPVEVVATVSAAAAAADAARNVVDGAAATAHPRREQVLRGEQLLLSALCPLRGGGGTRTLVLSVAGVAADRGHALPSPATALTPEQVWQLCGNEDFIAHWHTVPTFRGAAETAQPPSLRGATLTAVGAHLYLYGGLTRGSGRRCGAPADAACAQPSTGGGSTLSAALWRFTPGEDHWMLLHPPQAAAPAPVARSDHVAAALPGGHMFVFGGKSASNAFLGDTWLWLADDTTTSQTWLGTLACSPSGEGGAGGRACSAAAPPVPLPELIPLELIVNTSSSSGSSSGGELCVEDVEVAIMLLHPCMRSIRIDMSGPEAQGSAARPASTDFIPLFVGGLGEGGASPAYTCTGADARAYSALAAATSPPHAPAVFADDALLGVHDCCAGVAMTSAANLAAPIDGTLPPVYTALRGRFRPLSSLRDRFLGVRAAGVWRLRVFDAELDGFSGLVVSWSVTITSRPCAPGLGWLAINGGGGSGPGPRAGAAVAVAAGDGALYLWGGVSEVTPLYRGEAPLPPPYDAVWRFSGTAGEWAWALAGQLRHPAATAAGAVMAGTALAATALIDSRRGLAEGGGICAQSAADRLCWVDGEMRRWDAAAGGWRPLTSPVAAAAARPAHPQPPPCGAALALMRQPSGQLHAYAYGGGKAGASSGASGELFTTLLNL